MSKASKLIVTLSLALTLLTNCQKQQQNQKNSQLPVIAITQIVEHPALDQEREGIITALKNEGFIDGQTVKIIYENAQGNIATSAMIANKLISQTPKVIIGISTPSAQSLKSGCDQNKIPLVFTAVSDPVAAKLISSMKEGAPYTTGVSDALNPKDQLIMIKEFLKDIKKVGVIFNPGEVNSVSAFNALKEAASSVSIELIASPASKAVDVNNAVNFLVEKVDAIYVPNDNIAVSAMNAIVATALPHKLPVFAGDTGSVQNGAIATIGFNRHDLGKKAGQMAVRIMKGESASTIAPQTGDHARLLINKAAAAKFGVIISPETLATADVF